MSRPNLTLRCGPGGAGKSYLATLWTVEEFLPFETARLITNVPLRPQVIAERVAKRHGLDAAAIAARIFVIDRETSESWKRDLQEGGSTPGMYFEGRDEFKNEAGHVDFKGAHILIDEAHWMISDNKSEVHQAYWRNWIGELRHQHATLELMTQAVDKLAKEVVKEHELRYECVSAERKRDVWLHIPFSDWAEAWAKVTGNYIPRFYLQEWRNTGSAKFKQQWEASFVYSPYYGECYNSYSAAGGSTEEGVGKPPERFFERLKGWRFWRWFISRNWMAAGYRLFWWCVGFGVPIGALWYASIPSKPKPPPIKPRPAVTAPRRDYVPVSPVSSESRETAGSDAGTNHTRIVGFVSDGEVDGLVLADGKVLKEGDKLNGKVIDTIICSQCYYVVDGVEHWLQTGRLAARAPKVRDTVRGGSRGRPEGLHTGGASYGSIIGGSGDAAFDPGGTTGGADGPGGRDRSQVSQRDRNGRPPVYDR